MRSESPQARAALKLSQLVIPTPCVVDWREMDKVEGETGRRRFCGHCQRNVYDLAKLTEKEILELVEGSGDRICGHLYRRADGTILTSDCQTPQRIAVAAAKPSRRLQYSIASLLVAITSSAALFASAPWLARKIEPIVQRWFTSPSAPAAPAPGLPPGLWVEGEIMIDWIDEPHPDTLHPDDDDDHQADEISVAV